MRLVTAFIAFASALAAQQIVSVVLGSNADPCVGGTPYTVPGGVFATLRFGSTFTCNFSIGGAGLFRIELDFEEPNAYVPASDPLGRSFNVSVTDSFGSQVYGQLQNMDLYSQGAKDATVPISRTFLAWSSDGKFNVLLSTNKRTAVLSRVMIMPYNPGFVDMSAYALKTDIPAPTPAPDLSNYVTKDALASFVPAAPDLSSYAKSSDLAAYVKAADIASAYVPYKGATGDVDLGPFAMVAGNVYASGPNVGYLYFNCATPNPTSTTAANGMQFDLVVYVDCSDRGLKMFLKDGTVVPVAKP